MIRSASIVTLALTLQGCLPLYTSTATDTEGSSGATGTSEPTSTSEPTAGTTGSTGASSSSGSGGATLPPAEVPEGCNPIAYAHDCMLPYPSDWFLVDDPELPGGRRVELGTAAPTTKSGDPVDNLKLHPADGFSAHMPILALFPGGIDTSNLTFHLDGGDATLDPASPTLLVDAETGELVPHWVELDAMAADPAHQALIVRPFVRLKDARRYVVAFQGLIGADGARIEAPLGFAHVLAGQVAGHPVLEPLAARYEAEVFPALAQAGVKREGLQLAWDFTTATEARNTGDLLAIRDDLLALLDQAPPTVMIDKVLPDHNEDIALRIEGRVEVPLYLEADQPMALIHRGPDGAPAAKGTTWATFTLQVPKSVFPTDPGFEPARIIQFGHGFFGEREEINWGAMRAFSSEKGFVMISTEWVGMALDDQPAVVEKILQDPSNVFSFTDRLHQAFANQLALSAAVQTALTEVPELMFAGKLMYDPQQLSWYGISQGSIFGMTMLALTPTFEKGVLSVGGGPYSLMMTRSGTFADLFDFVKVSLGDDPLAIQKYIAMSQHTWDRVDPAAYAPHVVLDPYPGSSRPAVLFQYGIGDHSVNNLASHLLLRAAGIDLLDPPAQEVWGVGTVPGPTAGSAAVPVDFKIPVLPGIESKLPEEPPDEQNAHELVRRNAKIKEQIDVFLRPGGEITNFCQGPCDPE